ncbi:MAG: metallophosphoesterase, partial [Actinomycetota bacterium]
MKIAITADLHLKTNGEYPERFNALKNILERLLREEVENLIIAGDLFDIGSQNYSIFDDLCKEKKYSNIKFYIIAGNHDTNVNSKYFTAANIKVFNEPEAFVFKDSPCSFLFIPYLPGRSMGEIIAENRHYIKEPWILIGHGDYLSGIRDPNTYEAGVYMPLARTDIEFHNPSRVILGHIHKKMETGRVCYPGSPCGMDINETGRRSFIMLDTDGSGITEKKVESDYIFFSETLIALPMTGEFDYIKKKTGNFKKEWDLSMEEIPRARIRLKVKGYTSDRKRLETVLQESLADFTFYNNEGPDLSSVSVFNDPERINIVERVKEKIDAIGESQGFSQSKKDLVMEQALRIILK